MMDEGGMLAGKPGLPPGLCAISANDPSFAWTVTVLENCSS